MIPLILAAEPLINANGIRKNNLNLFNTIKNIILIILSAGFITACSFVHHKAQPTLYYWGKYQWGKYQNLHYQSFNDAKPLPVQIQEMENYFNKVTELHAHTALESHAHLGMLYAKNGDIQAAKIQFDLEK